LFETQYFHAGVTAAEDAYELTAAFVGVLGGSYDDASLAHVLNHCLSGDDGGNHLAHFADGGPVVELDLNDVTACKVDPEVQAPERNEQNAQHTQSQAQSYSRVAMLHKIEVQVHCRYSPLTSLQGVLPLPHEKLEQGARHDYIGKYAGYKADGQGNAKSADRPGSEKEQDDRRY
jgi:hypothetical protein